MSLHLTFVRNDVTGGMNLHLTVVRNGLVGAMRSGRMAGEMMIGQMAAGMSGGGSCRVSGEGIGEMNDWVIDRMSGSGIGAKSHPSFYHMPPSIRPCACTHASSCHRIL